MFPNQTPMTSEKTAQWYEDNGGFDLAPCGGGTALVFVKVI